MQLRKRTIEVLTRDLTLPQRPSSSSSDSFSEGGRDFDTASGASGFDNFDSNSENSDVSDGETRTWVDDGRNGPNLPPVNMSIEKAKVSLVSSTKSIHYFTTARNELNPKLLSALQALKESSLSVEDPTLGERSTPSSEESEDLLQHLPHELPDSGLTPSVTTIFDSGRSDDSGASTSRKLSNHLVELDKMIADAENELHGTNCVCHRCIHILNVDGNDSPDISTESSAEGQDDLPEARASARVVAQDSNAPLSKQADINEGNIETQMPLASNGNQTSGLGFEPIAGGSGEKMANVVRESKKTKTWNEKPARRAKGHLAAQEALKIMDDMSDGSDADAEPDENNIASLLRNIDEKIEFVVRESAHDKVGSDNASDNSDHEASDLEERYRKRGPRVRRSWDSDSETTTSCDETDYSDEEDLRNFFAEANGTDLRRAKDHPLLGKEPRDYDDLVDINNTIELDSTSDEDRPGSVSQALSRA